jgi:hypothetical protein
MALRRGHRHQRSGPDRARSPAMTSAMMSTESSRVTKYARPHRWCAAPTCSTIWATDPSNRNGVSRASLRSGPRPDPATAGSAPWSVGAGRSGVPGAAPWRAWRSVPPWYPVWGNESRPLNLEEHGPPPGPRPPIWRSWVRLRPTPTFADPWVDTIRSVVFVDVQRWPAADRHYAWSEPAVLAPSLELDVAFHEPAPRPNGCSPTATRRSPVTV